MSLATPEPTKCDILAVRLSDGPEGFTTIKCWHNAGDDEPKYINTIEIIADGKAVLKRGLWNTIQWEAIVYSHVQRQCGFPIVCERHVDFGTNYVRAGLILRRVVVFESLFINQEPLEPPRFPFSVTAAIGAVLILRMQRMHSNGILHTDIHPGNLAFSSFRALPELVSALHAHQIDALNPTFIDFGLAQIHGYHPMGDSEYCLPMWTYTPDRVVRGHTVYTAADDLESLAYSLLAFQLMNHPPWHTEDAHAFDTVEEFASDFLAARAQSLEDLRTQRVVEPLLLDLIDFARGLQPGGHINYWEWSSRLNAVQQ